MPERPKLLERVRQELHLRHYSPRTEAAYVGWIRQFIVAHGLRHPREMGAEELAALLTWLAVGKRVAAIPWQTRS